MSDGMQFDKGDPELQGVDFERFKAACQAFAQAYFGDNFINIVPGHCPYQSEMLAALIAYERANHSNPPGNPLSDEPGNGN